MTTLMTAFLLMHFEASAIWWIGFWTLFLLNFLVGIVRVSKQ